MIKHVIILFCVEIFSNEKNELDYRDLHNTVEKCVDFVLSGNIY